MSDALREDCLYRARSAPVYHVATRTPVVPATLHAERLGCEVWLKREDLQPTFSFKLRGAYARLAACQPGTVAVTASAGNHAQGVALAAARLGLRAEIVMPRTTPKIKVNAVHRLGAVVHLQGDDYDSASAVAHALAKELQGVFIHPFDDLGVIAGQATIALELVEQCPQAPHEIYVPVGGGGLLAGIATVTKALWPDTKIIAVEPADAACLAAAVAAGRPVRLDHVGLFADGAAVGQIGELPFLLTKNLIDDIITVDADALCAAIHDIYTDTRALVEPAGALAVAGITQVAASATQHLRRLAIVSGANINFDRLAHVVERSEMGLGHEALLTATIPERPGSFLDFCRALCHRAITEFNYRYAHADHAQVFVGLRLDTPGERSAAIQRLATAGYAVSDLSDNELARQHVRHLVGGVLPDGQPEVLIRFQFPERPGALEEFLTKLAGRWNISLFHYRNHGAASGRVLAGFMVPRTDRIRLHNFLDSTGYPWFEETDNLAYRQFLAPKAPLRKVAAR